MIAQFLFRNPRMLLLVVMVVVVAGGASLVLTPRLEDPVLGRRVAVISTVFPGANAQRVESLVTLKIEQALQGIGRLREVRSTSQTGISNVVVQLSDNVSDVDAVWTEVRDRLEDVFSQLPEGCDSPELEVFPLKAFALILAIQPDRDRPTTLTALRTLASELGKRIRGVPGTEAVYQFGDPGEELVAEVSGATLAGLRTSTAAIASQLEASRSNLPMGEFRGEESAALVRLAESDLSANTLGQLELRFGADRVAVPLADVAEIKRRAAEPETEIALIDGQRAMVLGALVDDEVRVDWWSSDVRRTLKDFQTEYRGVVKVRQLFSQDEFIQSRMQVLLRNLLLGGLGVLIVVFFLMGWRSMLVVGAALPLSSLVVLAGMRFLDIPLHQMSVTGLIVALGLLIDNAIIVVEDIRGRVATGVPIDDAIGNSTHHLFMPLFASTLTTALAFLPIVLLPGPSGEFVGTIAISVILAISASFALSMFILPALLALVGVGSLAGFHSRVLESTYRWSLSVLFRWPIVGVVAGALIPAIGFSIAAALPRQFFPPSDRHQICVEVELPAREPLDATLEAVEAVQRSLDSDGRIETADWFLGRSAPTFYYNVVPRRRGTRFYAQAMVTLTPGSDVQAITGALQRRLTDEHPDLRVLVRRLDQGPPVDAPIEVQIFGPDLVRLQELGNQLRRVLSETPGIVHTRSDGEDVVPTYDIDIRQSAASLAGLNQQDVARFIYTTLEGADAGTIFDGREDLPIRVRLKKPLNADINALNVLPIPAMATRKRKGISGPDGPPPPDPPLGAIADLTLGSNVAAITHVDGRRVNEVKAYIEAGMLPATILSDFRQRLADSGFTLPAGYEIEYVGEEAERTQATQNLMANAVLLFSIIILTLVAVFQSFRLAAIIVCVGGLTIGLGPLSLWLFGFPFGFMAVVGTMGLVGVAINDSIVVLAAIREHESKRGSEPRDLVGVVESCTRHVVATTFTTIIGFLPLVLGGGGFWPPLAIVMSGGVLGATLLAIYFVPSLYLLLRPAD